MMNRSFRIPSSLTRLSMITGVSSRYEAVTKNTTEYNVRSGSCIVPILLILYIHYSLVMVPPVSHFLEAPSLSITLHSKLHGHKKSRERIETTLFNIVQINIIAKHISLNYKGSINLQRSIPNGEMTSRSLRSIAQLSRVGVVRSVGPWRYTNFDLPHGTFEKKSKYKELENSGMLLLTMPSCRIQLCIQFKHSNCDVYFRINFTRLTHTSNYIHNYDCHSISFTKHHLVSFNTFTFTFYGAFPLGSQNTEKTLSTQCERQLALLHGPRQVIFLPPRPVGHGSHDELRSTEQCCPLDFALDTIHYTPPPPPPP